MKSSNNGRVVWIVCLAVFGLALMLTDLVLAWLSFRDDQLIAAYECGYLPEQPCQADFDGDGRLTQIDVRRRHDAPVELPPSFQGTEPQVVLNVYSIDNTSRTHVGLRNEAGRARLIIYNGVKSPGQNAVNVVFAWNGNNLSEVAPAEIDKEILSAMAARDDAGTFNKWVVYYVLAWPVRVVYVLLLLAAVLSYRKNVWAGARILIRVTAIG